MSVYRTIGPLVVTLGCKGLEHELSKVQDLFHVYLNKCEFQFLLLHINKTNTFCFLIDNGRVTGTTK